MRLGVCSWSPYVARGRGLDSMSFAKFVAEVRVRHVLGVPL
jgi:hypothetical protein